MTIAVDTPYKVGSCVGAYQYMEIDRAGIEWESYNGTTILPGIRGLIERTL